MVAGRAGGAVPLPVTVLSGFLGSGKTTLVKHLLGNSAGLRIAVIVNDLASLNVDAAAVRGAGPWETVALENGCICCTLRSDLLDAVGALALRGGADYCVVESTGVGEPMGVAEAFTMAASDAGLALSELARLDTMVTVVDCAMWAADLGSVRQARERWGQLVDAQDDRPVASLLIEQVEFANVILLNKTDLVEERTVGEIRAVIKTLNPTAEVVPVQHTRIDPLLVLNTGRFSFEQASLSKGWLESLRNPSAAAAKKPETEEFRISSFVYRRRRPFHPARFMKATRCLAGMRNIFRCKGYVWIGGRDEGYGDWSLAGSSSNLEPHAKWLACTPREDWPGGGMDPEINEKIRLDFDEDPSIGDRRQEVVIIGQDLDKEVVEKLLDGSLVTDEEWKNQEALAEDPAIEKWDFEYYEDEPEGCGDPDCELDHTLDSEEESAENSGEGSAEDSEDDSEDDGEDDSEDGIN